MREWWNGRHTVLRGRRAQPIRVQIPSRAPGSCERIRLKTLSHSKSRRMHMAPVGANMAHWESWLIRLPVTQKITGSSPVWVAKNTQKVQFLPITHECE